MSASSNTRSGGNPKVIQKAKDKAEVKRIIDPNTKLEKAHNIASGAILGRGGIVSAAQNTYLLGKKVVHGSPTPGLKKIDPQTGSGARPNENVVFSWNPSKFRDKGEIAPMVREYSNKNGTNGSVYVGKLKRSDIIKTDPKETPPSFVVSKGPIKVTKEIKVKPQTNKSLGNEIKKSFPGRDTTKIKGKIDATKHKRVMKKLRSGPDIA